MRGKWTHRIIKELRRVRAELRRGWIGKAEAAALRGQGYLSRVLSGDVKHVDVELLFSVFEHAGIDVRDFLMRIGLELSAPTPDQYLARILREHDDADLLLNQMEASCKSARAADTPATSVTDIQDELNKVDELHFSDPGKAEDHFVSLLTPDIPKTLPRQLAMAFCQYADLQRSKGRLGVAARALKSAFRHTPKQTPEHAIALQRLSYLFSTQGWQTVAAEFARQAVEVAVLSFDPPTIGRMLVTEGTMLRRQGDAYRTRIFLESSLAYLSDSSWTYQAKANEGLGWCAMEVGELDRAHHHLSAAASIHRSQHGIHWIRILWKQSEVAVKRGDFQVAHQLVRKMLKDLPEATHAIDQALIMLQLSKVHFLQQNTEELVTAARGMMQFLTPLQHDHVASVLIAEFIKAAQAGRVTFRSFEETRAKLLEIRTEQGTPTLWW